MLFDVRAALFALLGKVVTQIDGSVPTSHLTLSLSAATTSPLGRAQNTLRLGSAWRRATRSPAAKCSRRLHAARYRYSTKRLLETALSTHRQGQGSDRHGAQDRSAVLQRGATRYALCRSERVLLRDPTPCAGDCQSASASQRFGFVLQPIDPPTSPFLKKAWWLANAIVPTWLGGEPSGKSTKVTSPRLSPQSQQRSGLCRTEEWSGGPINGRLSSIRGARSGCFAGSALPLVPLFHELFPAVDQIDYERSATERVSPKRIAPPRPHISGWLPKQEHLMSSAPRQRNVCPPGSGRVTARYPSRAEEGGQSHRRRPSNLSSCGATDRTVFVELANRVESGRRSTRPTGQL
ncbi:hypothetical protein ABIB73_007594 [Bradyrhizobium sp. F1.4.3]